MWSNEKTTTKLFSPNENLQTYYHFELDFQKVEHTAGKWLIYGT